MAPEIYRYRLPNPILMLVFGYTGLPRSIRSTFGNWGSGSHFSTLTKQTDEGT